MLCTSVTVMVDDIIFSHNAKHCVSTGHILNVTHQGEHHGRNLMSTTASCFL